jgi:hypothetical protein
MAVKSNTKVNGIKSSTLAVFEGTFAGIIGLAIAVLWSLQNTIQYTQSTNSLLSGLVFGLASGIVSIVVLPFIYFAIGWVIGYIHGFIFNVVAETSGGLVVRTEEIKK